MITFGIYTRNIVGTKYISLNTYGLQLNALFADLQLHVFSESLNTFSMLLPNNVP